MKNNRVGGEYGILTQIAKEVFQQQNLLRYDIMTCSEIKDISKVEYHSKLLKLVVIKL